MEDDFGEELDEGLVAAPEGEPAAAAPLKDKLKKKRKRGPKLAAVEFEASRALAAELPERGAAEQADWLWAGFSAQTGATELERDGLTGACFAELPRTGTLEERLMQVEPEWAAAFCGARRPPPGSPGLLMVSPSAMGAVNLIKLCPQFNRVGEAVFVGVGRGADCGDSYATTAEQPRRVSRAGRLRRGPLYRVWGLSSRPRRPQACCIGRLFAKHMKVPEQEAALRAEPIGAAAGTPNRLVKLAESGALKLDRLRLVVLDVSLDAKKMTILDHSETRADLCTLLKQHLLPLLAAGQARLALFRPDA